MWAVLLLVLNPLCMGGTPELPAHKRQSVQYSTLVGPSFINTTVHLHTHTTIGHTAHLTCIVRNLHNYTVSWVRARDIHLLTADVTTYTSDNRFVSVNPGGGSRWVLRIHHARLSDTGTYLCQISLSPPISTPVTLTVTKAMARVEPGPEVFMREGGEVILVCEVRGCPYPALPTWYRGHQIQQGTEVYEGTVSKSSTSTLATIPSATLPIPKRRLHSYNPMVIPVPTTTPAPSVAAPIGLPIARITLKRPSVAAIHSGVYTCTNTCTNPINLTLHILTGDEETAAMQHPSGCQYHQPSLSLRVLVLTVPLVYLVFS